jgi:FkbM family methyltransferase
LKLYKLLSFKDKIRRFFVKLFKIDMFSLKKFALFEKYIQNGLSVQNCAGFYLLETKIENSKFVIKLREQTSDFDVFYQVFENKEYEPIVQLVQRHGKEISTIFDAGANVGYTSIYLSAYFPAAKFFLFEPESSNFQSIEYHIDKNKLSNFTPLKKGVWTKETNLKVEQNFRDQRHWAFTVKETSENTGLEGVSFQKIMADAKIETIDLLKMDIEGSEKVLFDDSNFCLELLPKVKFMALEIHDEIVDRNKIVEILKSNNFDFFSKGETMFCVNKNLVA